MDPAPDGGETAEIDDALERGAVPFRFPHDRERLYRRHALAEHRRTVVRGMLVGLGLFDAFVVSDWLLLRDSLAVYLVGKFLLVTPLCLACCALAIRSDRLYAAMVALFPAIVTAGLAAMLWWSAGPDRVGYLSGVPLIMVGGVALGRPRRPHAAAAVLAQCACYAAVALGTNVVPQGGRLVGCLICLCGAAVSLFTAHALEAADRRAFLLGLRADLLNRHLRAVALLDPLTGLGNRRALDEAWRRHWGGAAPRRAALVMLDIDHFKAFNDGHGHQAGDACLGRVARSLRGEVRPGETAVRFGGEEIAVFLPDADPARARARAEDFRRAVRRAAVPHPAVRPGAVVTASVGVACASTDACSFAALVGRADRALYAAKRNGRDRVWDADTGPAGTLAA